MSKPPSKRVGLALGGGVARGLAHVGVLNVLLRAGIPIDVVSGSSAGALVGAAYCAGLDIEQIKILARKVRWWHLARPTWPLKGFVSFAGLEKMLKATIGDLDFSDLKIPFAVAATDLETGEAVVIHSGRVAPAVRASCSVPGVVTPVEIEGHILGDGNFSASVPTAAARSLGADYIIGVDIFQPALRKHWGPFGYGFAALEILIQRIGSGLEGADCLIAPDLAGRTYLRLEQAEVLITLGERAAEAKLPDIQAALAIAS
jgi:NTE family protein